MLHGPWRRRRYNVVRLEERDNVSQLPNGHPVIVMRHPRLSIHCNQVPRVTGDLVGRVDDRAHEMSIRNLTPDSSSKLDEERLFRCAAFQVCTGDLMARETLKLNERDFASLRIAVPWQAKAGG
jgi:hypothetical protein